jgi:hypothetical protein
MLLIPGPRKLELRSFSDSPENRMNIHQNAPRAAACGVCRPSSALD